MFLVREAENNDLGALLQLYLHLHETTVPDLKSEAVQTAWRQINADPNHHILLGCVDENPVSSCVVVVVPNLTRGPRPYALVENVVTLPEERRKGYATVLLKEAEQIAREAGCYKMMLLTGSKEEATLNFYRRAGYNAEDKTAFIRWLK